MINQHVVYYLGSKLIAALLNLGTMVVSVRLGGAETYGAYVVALAWGYIVYSFTLQWLRFAFFATYDDKHSSEFIGTYLRLLVGGIGILAVLALGAVAAGFIGFDRKISVVALVAGLAIYDALHEMGRTRLQARAVAAAAMARAALMLILSVVALKIDGSATALALAVALAHVLATVPLVINLGSLLKGQWSGQVAGRLYSYGRGLMPAYALDGIGLQLDRLLLARSASLTDVGSYGAVADLVRQIMVVISEAISGAYIAIARSELKAGREDAAVEVLGRAFLAFTALAAFGTAGILRFNSLIFQTLFGAQIADAIDPVMPLILASSVLLVFRSYYLGQVLYLTNDSSLLVRSNGVHCAVMAVLGVILTPMYGMFGVAIALTLAHVGGCLVNVWAWRGTFALRLPYAKAAVIVVIAALAFVTTGMVAGGLPGGSGSGSWAVAAVNALIFLAAVLLTARLYNLLSFNDAMAGLGRSVKGRLQRQAS